MKSLLKLFLLCQLLLVMPAWAGEAVFDVAHSTGAGDWLQIDTRVADQAPTPGGPQHAPPNGGHWQARELGVRTVGFEYKGVWARTALQNSSDTPKLGWLVVTEPYIVGADRKLTT